MAEMYYETDADLSVLEDKIIGIIGYGSQGHAHALNLRDSGLNVMVGLYDGSQSWAKAESDDLEVATVSEVAEKSDVIMMLLPDHLQSSVYKESIQQHMLPGKTLMFAHGFNIHYEAIVAPNGVDVSMVAPKAPGHRMREVYTKNSGVPGLLAVHQDASGEAHKIGLAYARGVGCTRAGVLDTTFKEETETDLYGEQALLTGGLPMMIDKSLKVLLEAGYSPLAAWIVCYYEIKMIVDLFHEKGFDYLYNAISDTARYGGLKSGDYLIDDEYENKLKNILKNIQNGSFIKDLEDNVDTLKYKSSLDTKHSDEISKIMNVLFEKTNKGK